MVFMGRQFVYSVASVIHGGFREYLVISFAVFNIIFSIALTSLVSPSVVSKEMSVSVSICQQQVLSVGLTDCYLLGRDAVSPRHLTFTGALNEGCPESIQPF